MNRTGLIFALFAILTTAQFQIWQGSKQKEKEMTDMQMTMAISFVQIFIGGFLAYVFEGDELYNFVLDKDRSNINIQLLAYIALSCLFAASANVHGFALIGRTSVITWQVVGHAKTCLIIIAGYILFDVPTDMERFFYNVLGEWERYFFFSLKRKD